MRPLLSVIGALVLSLLGAAAVAQDATLTLRLMTPETTLKSCRDPGCRVAVVNRGALAKCCSARSIRRAAYARHGG